MAPYRYDRPENAAAGTIGDLLLRRGDIEANRAIQIANANARATEASGQAWAGAARGVGDAVAGTIAQATDPKRLAEQRSLEAQKALSAAMKTTPKLQQDGTSLWDVNAVTQRMADLGFGPEGAAAAPHLNEINDGFLNFRKSQQQLITTGAAKVAAGGNDPALAHDFLDQVEANNVAPKETIQKYRDFIDADPGNVAKLTSYLMGPQKGEVVPEGARVVNPVTGAVITGAQPKAGEGQHVINGQLVGPDGQPIGPQIPKEADPVAAAREAETARHNRETERIAGLTTGRQDAAEKETERHNRAMEAEGDTAPTLTPEALKLTAKQYAMTGQLPPMGMGKQGAKVRTQIINAAADEYKNLDLPSQIAAYKANQGSLVKLQQQRDAIGSFETTAKKNIDLFLDTAGKVVDTGSPLANTLLRQASGKVLGSPDQAAYDAARQVAVNEIAKITSNPTLSGTLSDSARHEVDAFNPASATLAQSVKVMRLLKQDMENRTSALDTQIKDIQTRIATPPGGSGSGTSGGAAKPDPLGIR